MDGITDSRDMSLSKVREMVKGREAWCAAVPGHGPVQLNSNDDTALSMPAHRRVRDSDQRGGRGRSKISRKNKERWSGKWCPGPRPAAQRGPSPPDASWPGLWSDPQHPQYDGHHDSRSLRAALGSWKPPRQDEEPGLALSLHDVHSACLAPGIPPVRGTAAVTHDRSSVPLGGLFCLSVDPCSPVGASAGVVRDPV